MTQDDDADRGDTGRAFSIKEFCERNGRISRSTFYAMRLAGKGPRLMKVSANRVAISPEAEAEWRREREAEFAGEGA